MITNAPITALAVVFEQDDDTTFAALATTYGAMLDELAADVEQCPEGRTFAGRLLAGELGRLYVALDDLSEVECPSRRAVLALAARVDHLADVAAAVTFTSATFRTVRTLLAELLAELREYATTEAVTE